MSRTSKFDIDEFSVEDKPNELFMLQNKIARTTTKKVACIDKIFDNMRKNYENEKQLVHEEEMKQQENHQVEQHEYKLQQDNAHNQTETQTLPSGIENENIEPVIEASLHNIIKQIEQGYNNNDA